METRKSLVFNRYVLNVEQSPEQILEKLYSHSYNDDNGFGFTYLRLEDNIIEARLVIRTPTSIKEYDPIEGMFNSKVVFIYDELEIFFDTQMHLVYTTASITKFNKAKTLLRISIGKNLSFKNINISPTYIFESMENLKFTVYITDLTIKKFQYKEGAYGRFTVHLEDSSIGKELLYKYMDDISKITIKLESQNYSDCLISTAAQNSFILKCKEDEFWTIVNLIKEYI